MLSALFQRMEEGSGSDTEGYCSCEDEGCFLCTESCASDDKLQRKATQSLDGSKSCCADHGTLEVSKVPEYDYHRVATKKVATKRKRKTKHEENTKHLDKFAKCLGSPEQATQMIQQYREYEANKQVKEGDVLLGFAIRAGLGQQAMKALFRIGYHRYKRLKDSRAPKTGCGNGPEQD